MNIETKELIGRYEPTNKMSTYHGKFGVLFQGKTSKGHKTLAEGIKVVMKKCQDIFDRPKNNYICAPSLLKEIKILYALNNHPNIIKLYDIIPANTYDFSDLILIYEHADADLEQIFKTNQCFTKLHVQYMLYNLLLGLKYMHSAKMVHLNLRTRNVVVNADCSIKLIDFHFAQNLAGPYKHEPLWTLSNRWYSAPEVVLSTEEKSKLYAVDMWSAGVIFTELLQMQANVRAKPDQRYRLFVTDADRFNMKKGRPLYNNRTDQLTRIFDVIGYRQMPREENMSDNEKKYLIDVNRNHNKRIDRCAQAALFEPGTFSSNFIIQVENLKGTLDTIFDNIDRDAMDLLKKLLTYDPEKRITVNDALRHEYFIPVQDPEYEFTKKPKIFESCPENLTKQFIIAEMMKFNVDDNSEKMLMQLGDMSGYMSRRIMLINAYCHKQYRFYFFAREIRHLILNYYCCCSYSYNDKIMIKYERKDVGLVDKKKRKDSKIKKDMLKVMKNKNRKSSRSTELKQSTTPTLSEEVAQIDSSACVAVVVKDEDKLTVKQGEMMEKIMNAYNEYFNENNRAPNDVQSFVTYCKTKKRIKGAKWANCKSVLETMKTS